MNRGYDERTAKLIGPFLDEHGYRLIKCEFVSEEGLWYLRVYIDRADSQDPIGIEDCVKVSRYLSKQLDREDFIDETYTLEVCSRGFLDESEQSGA